MQTVDLPGAAHALPAYRPEAIHEDLLDHLLAAEEAERLDPERTT